MTFNNNRFTKRGHDVGREDITAAEKEASRWSFRGEAGIAPDSDTVADLELVHPEGIRAARKAGCDLSVCSTFRVVLHRPMLAVDNCKDIIKYIAPVAVLNTYERYILGYNNFARDRVALESSFDVYFAYKITSPIAVVSGGITSVSDFPSTGLPIFFVHTHFAVKDVPTPAWVLEYETWRDTCP